MNTFIGHTRTVAALETALPPVALVTGPASVGKWTLTQHLAAHHRVLAVDRWTHPAALTVAHARAIIDFTARAPFGHLKLVNARLDMASDAALNALLKTLEEPPTTVRFLFTSATTVLPTVLSRATVYPLGLLRTDELREILTAQGMNEAAAARAALLGRGQVRPAQQAAAVGEATRDTVLAVLRALHARDRDAYDRAFTGFDDAARDLLTRWLCECLTGQWAVFGARDSFGARANPGRLRAMVTALVQVRAAGSRLGVRAALEPFLST